MDYGVIADTDEDDGRLALLHKKVRAYDTISNTVADALVLEGVVRRRLAEAEA